MQRTLSSNATLAGAAIVVIAALMAPAASAHEHSGYSVEVLVDGRPLTEYPARGTTYVEARRDAEYAVRLSNQTSRRAAVALAVDGLNSIDARTTSARAAAKWVLEPYESIVVEGWQISSESARRFYFTTESHSYGAWLGETANLGVIEAAFFRERRPDRIVQAPAQKREGSSSRPGAPVEPEALEDSARRRSDETFEPDDYAATGIGRKVDNPVRRIRMDLEKRPAASFRIRYEYREQLVRLGVLPWPWAPDPLTRREQANGFAPDPYGPSR
jgi:hypothetical protein